MNTRERFVQSCKFQTVDQVPFVEIGAWAQARDRWFEEGMPKDAETNFNVLRRAPYFGLEHFDELPINTLLCPPFERKIIEEDEHTETFRDQFGQIRKALKTGRGKSGGTRASMDQFLRFAVKSRADFDEIKKRFTPDDPARFPDNWQELLKEYKTRDYPLCLQPGGNFGLYSMLRRFMGTENACTVFYDDPALADDMLDCFTDFFIAFTGKVLSQVQVDWYCIFEDFAFKTGPLVSPMIFKKFLLKRYRRINDHLRSCGVDIISIDSDGNTEVLLPMIIEAGYNHILPMEQAADMDAVRIRKQYGNALGMLGSIDKRELAKGKKEIERELLRQVPYLLESGGYIPTVDHTVPHDVSYENFLYYLDVKRKLVEGCYGA